MIIVFVYCDYFVIHSQQERVTTENEIFVVYVKAIIL